MRAEDDAIIAEIALKRGWVDKETLGRALEIQSAASAIELDESLLDILVTKKFITDRQARELEDQIGVGRLTQPEHCEDIAGYRIMAKLGQGGMGAVFKAEQLSMQRVVALKVLAPELASDPGLVERFGREARAIGRVSHANIVSGLDSGRSDDYHYYTMEYVEGENLYRALRGGPLPIPKLLVIAVQIARALKHAASLGMVHRDIKPSNIIVTAEGIAKLCDLGLARSPDDPSVTGTGVAVGTPHYVSPELARGSTELDIRSDIYSFGATLYHLVTAEYPFRADSGAALRLKHIEETLRPPIELRPDIPPALDAMICKMMAKNPADRYQTPDEVLLALGRVQAGLSAARRAGDTPVPELPQIASPALPEPVAPTAPPEVVDAQESAEEPVDQAEAPPLWERWSPRRLFGSPAWMLTFGLLLVVLVCAVVWAMRSRQQGGEPAATQKPKPRMVVNTADGSDPKEPPKAASVADDSAARLAAALAFDKANPKAHGKALLELRLAALSAAPSALAAKVHKRLATRRTAHEKAAGSAWSKLEGKVKGLRERDRFGEALQACAQFPAEHRHGTWAELVDTRIVTLGAQAERRYLELANTGQDLLMQGKFDKALQAYERITTLGVSWIARAGGTLLNDARRYAERERKRVAEGAQAQALAKRRKSFGRLTKMVASIVASAKSRQYAEALAVCEGMSTVFREGELGAAVVQLHSRLKPLAELWKALCKNPSSLHGKPFRLHGIKASVVGVTGAPGQPQLSLRMGVGRSQRTHRQPLRHVRPSELAQLAEWVLADRPAAERALTLGMLDIAEGRGDEAREQLAKAKEGGKDVAPFVQELDAAAVVSKAMAAFDKREWKGARVLLETALDRHAAASAVIAEHPRLMAALSQCRRKLGDREPTRQPAPSPLPRSLRRLVVLPATRLSPASPPKLVDAYMREPAQRRSPVLLGLGHWDNYAIHLRWTFEKGDSLVVLFRVSEPLPGQFAYYYLRVRPRRVVLGRVLTTGAKELDSRPWRSGRPRAHHSLFVNIQGAEISATVDRKVRLRASDSSLTRGNIGLAAAEAQVMVENLSVFFLLNGNRHR